MFKTHVFLQENHSQHGPQLCHVQISRQEDLYQHGPQLCNVQISLQENLTGMDPQDSTVRTNVGVAFICEWGLSVL